MVKHEKLLARIRANPNAVRFADLVLQRSGFTSRQVGSHVVYSRAGLRLTVPYRVPHLHPLYVKQALKVIDAAQEDSENE